MPIYEYRCKKCGKQFEYMQRMSESPKKKCESCGALALERLISHTSFQLKGSGWYKDLYSSSKPASGGSESGSGSESGTGAESKPETVKEKSAEPSGQATDKKKPKKKGSA